MKEKDLILDGKCTTQEFWKSMNSHAEEITKLSKFHRKNVEIIDIDNVKFKGFVTHYADEIENDGEISITIEIDNKVIIEFEKNEIKSIKGI